MYQFHNNSREFLVDLIPCACVQCVTYRKLSNGWHALDYIEEWNMCKKKSWRKWLFTDFGKRDGEKASLVDPEKTMKLCSLLICSTAGTCWTVPLVKLSKVNSPWKHFIKLLEGPQASAVFWILCLRGATLPLSIHEHTAAGGVCSAGVILTLPSLFVRVWDSEQLGQWRTVKPGLCGPEKQHHRMGYKLLGRINISISF